MNNQIKTELNQIKTKIKPNNYPQTAALRDCLRELNKEERNEEECIY